VFHRKVLVAVAGVILCLGLSGCATYSCGGSSGGHCYATVSWGKGDLQETDFRGFLTVVTPVQLNKGNLVINDELWLYQQGTNTCGLGACWAEVGVTSGACSTGSDTRYFWADNTPAGFICRDLGPVQPQEFGQPTMLVIARLINQTDAFEVDIEPCSRIDGVNVPCPRRPMTHVSFGNPMQPNVATIGTELGGSSGANAPPATFTENWHPDHFFAGAWVTTTGSPQVQTPPLQGSWTVNPSVQTEGGTWTTSCCQ